ncbi:L,D-transpeptidase family protein [Psychrobacter alimentarius]|uniref:L,D-transpeptidase family protein n=1 Tax=Psychrobacter alimentarius TaxID=261164 RepID=UPI00103C9A93
MSFFHTHASKHSNWLFVAIGLGLATIVSAGAVIYVNSHSEQPSPIPDTTIIDKVLVIKSQRVLKLLSGDAVIQSYKISLGGNPVGHKQQKGDNRTPVGSYTLDYKNENSIAYRSIHVSYPNTADKARAQLLGVDAGGDIMIHGQMNGFGHLAWFNQKRDWTEGCIAVTNEEIDEIMAAVNVGTLIEIVE